MKRHVVLFVSALIGYLVVASLIVTCVWANTSPGSFTEEDAPEGVPETRTDTSDAEDSDPTISSSQPVSRVQYGMASWYGRAFHGRPTASGERFDMTQVTAAHRTAPLGTHAIVTNLDNGQAIRVRINDRGPYVRRRMLDLSYGAAQRLGMVQAGAARVKVEFLHAAAATDRARTDVETSQAAFEAAKDQEVPAAAGMPATFFKPEGALRLRLRPLVGDNALVTPTTAGWFAVQAGTFRDLRHAVQMQKALMAHHPTVWVSSLDAGHQLLHCVQVGPFRHRDEAERTARYMAMQGFGLGMVLLQH